MSHEVICICRIIGPGWEQQTSSLQHRHPNPGARPAPALQALCFSFLAKGTTSQSSCTGSSSLLQSHQESCAVDRPPLLTYPPSRTQSSLLRVPRISSRRPCLSPTTGVTVRLFLRASHRICPLLDDKLHQSWNFLFWLHHCVCSTYVNAWHLITPEPLSLDQKAQNILPSRTRRTPK